MQDYQVYSKKTKQLYDTVKDLKDAEAKYDLALAEKQKVAEARGARAKEIEAKMKEISAAQKELRELIAQFNKDYGTYHTSIDLFNQAMDSIFNFWF